MTNKMLRLLLWWFPDTMNEYRRQILTDALDPGFGWYVCKNPTVSYAPRYPIPDEFRKEL